MTMPDYESAQSTRVRPSNHSYRENGCSVRSNDMGHTAVSPPVSRPPSTFSNSHVRKPSSSTTDPSPPSDDSLHTIYICRQTAEGLGIVCEQTVEPGLLKDQSTVLDETVKESRRKGRNVSRVLAEAPVNVEALQVMLKMITRGVGQGNRTQMPFNRFLDLSIAFWYFRSSTSQLQHWAEALHDNSWAWDLENRTPGQFRGWMFIALIFGWDVVFEQASLEIVTEYRPSDDRTERKFLPEELENAIRAKRAETLSKTYEFIHNKWLILYGKRKKNPMSDAIADELESQLNIHIHQPDKPDQTVSSGKFLRVFEAVVQQTLDKCHGLHPKPPADLGMRPPHKTPTSESRHKTAKVSKMDKNYVNVRGGLIREVLGQHEVKEEIKSKMHTIFGRTKPPPKTPPKDEPKESPMEGLEEVCKTLLIESKEFRTLNFRGLDIQDFFWLRDEHVLP